MRGAYVIVEAGSAVCNALDYGAACDGRTDDTAALTAMGKACAKGGTAVIPAGRTCMSYALKINKPNNFVLSVEGTLRFFNDTKGWPHSDSWCIELNGGQGVAMTGGGLVDGQGFAWWSLGKSAFRPGMVHAESVADLLVHNLTFKDSPNHNLEFYASPMEVTHTNVLASPGCDQFLPPGAVCAHNTDAIDVHGNYAYIHDSYFSVGDDNLALHANHTLAERMTFGRGHGASIGSLGEDTYLVNITVRDSSFNGTEQAVRIKADPGATGFLRDVLYTNLTMEAVGQTLLLTQFYGGVPPAGPKTTIAMSNISFTHIVSKDASQMAGQFLCDANAPCTGITVDDVQHTGTLPPAGWQCWNVSGSVDSVTPALSCFGQ